MVRGRGACGYGGRVAVGVDCFASLAMTARKGLAKTAGVGRLAVTVVGALLAMAMLAGCGAPSPAPPAAAPTVETVVAPPASAAPIVINYDDGAYHVDMEEDGALLRFEPNSGAEVSLLTSEEANHTAGGASGLLVRANRQYGGASADISEFLEQGGKYEISVWVKPVSPLSYRFNASLQLAGEKYPTLVPGWEVYCYANVWTELKGAYTFSEPVDGARVVAQIWGYRDGDVVEFYVDDVTVRKIETEEELGLGSLKEAYAPYFMMGAATAANYYTGGVLNVLKKHFEIITPENEFKPASLFPANAASMADIDVSAADKFLDDALANGFLVHGHTLIWHSQTAEWLNSTRVDGVRSPIDAEAARANMKAFIDYTVKHFSERAGGKLVSYDVVNEAFSDGKTGGGVGEGSDWRGYLRGAGEMTGAAVSNDPAFWYYSIGDTYIEDAFLYTYEADPNVKRFYNDYNLDQPGKAQAVANMVRDINARYRDRVGGNLIQGVGMQGHYSLVTKPADVERSIKLFIDAGVDVAFSELDVMIESYGNPKEATDERLERQAKLYGELFGVFIKYAEHIDRITFWGVDDEASWRREYSPLLFEGSLKAKPAFYAVLEAAQ